MTDATARYTSFRIALASGLLGAAGATLGWLAWLTVRVANPELLVTVFAGASLGLAVHWIQHYVRVARRERDGSPAEHAAAPGPTMKRRAAVAWAAGFGFLGLVTEHLIADMAAEFLQPFLASIAALLPAGMILGYTLSQGRWKDEGFLGALMYGFAVGAVITVVTGLIWTAGFGTAPWFALFAWWGLIGIGTRIVARSGRHSVRIFDPLLAVAIVFVATLLIDQLPTSLTNFKLFGPWQGVPAMLRAMVLKIHQSPDLPAKFWMSAEQRFIDKQGGDACPVPIWARKPAAIAAPLNDSIASKLPSDPLQAAIARAAEPLDTTVAVAAADEPKPGAGTEFLRSWLVIVLFAAGLGLAPWLEKTLRPIDYPNSETYRRDITLTVVVVLMLIGACVFARLDQRKAAAREQACILERLQHESTPR